MMQRLEGRTALVVYRHKLSVEEHGLRTESCDLSCHWRHSNLSRDTGARRTFTSLADAFRQYEWSGRSWAENFAELTSYRKQLRKAIADSDRDAAFEVCEPVLRWGRVWANNGRTLATHRTVLLDELRRQASTIYRKFSISIRSAPLLASRV